MQVGITRESPDRGWIVEETPLVVLAEGCFGTDDAKMAAGVLRYGAWPVTAIIDSTHTQSSVLELTGIDKPVPIVGSLSEALCLQPYAKALLIGTAPIGGQLPDSYRAVVKQAIEAKLHVINGLHVLLNSQSDLRTLASQKDVLLWDVRSVPEEHLVTQQLARPPGVKVITTVGSDCSVGKMSTALEVHTAFVTRGMASSFVATGQTGVVISGAGIALDRVIGDFMAGCVERVISETIEKQNPQWVVVEGQGSLLHPAYSGVTLSLIHGSAPDNMIFCHNPKYSSIKQYEKVMLPTVKRMIALYEEAAHWIKPAKVSAVSLNTSGYPDKEANLIIHAMEAEVGLPVTDPIRYGPDRLVSALLAATDFKTTPL